MPRRKCCRRVEALPGCPIYKPAGVPVSLLREVSLTIDEFESLRLADYEGLYQAQAAERMSVSRATFGRIVEAARRKVAEALVEGCALRIEGGEVEMVKRPACKCAKCGHPEKGPQACTCAKCRHRGKESQE